MKAAVVLFLLLAQEDRVRELIERLRSDDADQRTQATVSLKKLGVAAVPQLERAARDPDLEVSVRARSALSAIELLAQIPPRFAAAFPGVIDRLAAGGDAGAPELLSEASLKVEVGQDALRAEDLQWIAPVAVRGARSPDLLKAVLLTIRRHRLTSAVFELLDLLEDPDVELRTLAMETITGLAGEHPEAAFYGEPSLAEDQVVRVCVVAVGDLDRDVVSRSLRRCLESPKTLRRRIGIRGLVRRDPKNALPILLTLGEDPSDAVRADVLLALGDLGDREASPTVLRQLGDPSDRVRTAAVLAAGKLKEPRAVPQLLPLLSSPNAELQNAACRALGALRAAEAVPELIRLFLSGGDTAQRSAAEGLRGFEGALVAPGLIHESAGKPADVRLRAVGLIGGLDAAVAAPALGSFLSRQEPDEVRVEVLRKLLHLRPPDLPPLLVPLLDDPGPEVRAFAARGLAELGSDDVGPRLEASLAAADPNAKYHAVMGLLALNSRGSAPKIVPLALEGKNPEWLRLGALRALEKLGGADEIPILKPLLGDPLYEVRASTSRILCWLGDPDSVATVFEETRTWSCLNAIRSPEDWARLTGLPVGEDLRGSRRELVERLAKKSGKTVEWSLVGDRWEADLAAPCVVVGRRTFVAEALRETMPTGSEFVLERDRIRVLPRESASDFWKAWREERGR